MQARAEVFLSQALGQGNQRGPAKVLDARSVRPPSSISNSMSPSRHRNLWRGASGSQAAIVPSRLHERPLRVLAWKPVDFNLLDGIRWDFSISRASSTSNRRPRDVSV